MNLDQTNFVRFVIKISIQNVNFYVEKNFNLNLKDKELYLDQLVHTSQSLIIFYMKKIFLHEKIFLHLKLSQLLTISHHQINS